MTVPVIPGARKGNGRESSFAIAIAFSTLAACASADVVQVTSGGMLIKEEATVAAPPSKVYGALAFQVGSWWNPRHTYSGDAKNLSIDARPGGCFCERLREGGVEHMRVVYLVPGETLRMVGGLGPLQGSGVAGSLTWKFTPAGDGTNVTITYSVGGFLDAGFEKMAPAVDGVLAEQLQRLRKFAETGSP